VFVWHRRRATSPRRPKAAAPSPETPP
jgi:hypothetical protein